MKSVANDSRLAISTSVALARSEKPAYEELYPLLEGLFLIQAQARETLLLRSYDLGSDIVHAKWEGGFPLLHRWDFPLDIESADTVLKQLETLVPMENRQLSGGLAALGDALKRHPQQEPEIWRCFLQHELEPWEEWVDTTEVDVASLLFLGRSCIRPSIEWIAEDLLERFPLPQTWLRGYCPVCGSLPALLMLENQGERRAYCSWCATKWDLHRLQCPYCDNRYHESLGYIFAESEPQYRVQYCRLCKCYFKLIDTRERIEPPYLPLEEWTTLHLDLLAQRSGWRQPPSPSPAVYGGGSTEPPPDREDQAGA